MFDFCDLYLYIINEDKMLSFLDFISFEKFELIPDCSFKSERKEYQSNTQTKTKSGEG